MATTGGPGRAVPGMVERSDVLGALERLLDDASEGRGGALFIVGPAGLGKTTVLEHAITEAEITVRGRCWTWGPGGGGVAVRFDRQALEQLLERKLPGGGLVLDTDGGEASDMPVRGRFYGILRGVREAAVRPLLVALDDLHWSDPDSLTVISPAASTESGLSVTRCSRRITPV